MRQSKFKESQRLAILAKQDAGQSVEEICRQHQISPATFYPNCNRDKQEVSIEEDDDKRRIKQLEQENSRLKKMYADLMIDYEILSEGNEVAKTDFGPVQKEELMDRVGRESSVRRKSLVLGLRRQT